LSLPKTSDEDYGFKVCRAATFSKKHTPFSAPHRSMFHPCKEGGNWFFGAGELEAWSCHWAMGMSVESQPCQGEAELMLGRRLRPSSAPASAMLKIWTSWISQKPWVYSYNLATLSCAALSTVVFVK